jgi:hypothetical protein
MTAVLDHPVTAGHAIDAPRPSHRPHQDSTEAPYGFEAPTLESTRATLLEILGAGRATDTLWTELLAAAGIKNTADLNALDRLAMAMQGSRDAVVSLIGSSLAIRVRTYAELTHVREICILERAGA